MLPIITLFGLLAMVFGTLMIWSPQKWSDGIIRFSQHPAFHPFEILTRLLFGAAFILAADQTLHPTIIRFVGYLLVLVGVGLLLTPPASHRQFARWSAQRFLGAFRISGLSALLFGAFLVHTTLIA